MKSSEKNASLEAKHNRFESGVVESKKLNIGDKICSGSQKQQSDENITNKQIPTSPKSNNSNTDKLASQNILNTFMNAVAADSLCNNNNNNNGANSLNLPGTNTAINPGLLYLSQLMGSDLIGTQPLQNGINNSKTQTQAVTFPQSQQNSFATAPNVEFLNNQAKLLQSSNFLEPLLQCSNYFKFMENYQKYASNILANSQNTINKPNSVPNSFSTLQSQVFNSVSKPATSPITPPTDTPSSSSFTNANTSSASNLNRVVSATSLC